MIKITKDEFFEQTGIDLYNEFNNEDTDPVTLTDITLNRWSKILYDEINKNSIFPIPNDDKLTENQINKIKDVLVNLGLYYLNNGDIKALGCVDNNGNHIAAVPQVLIDDLRRNTGLIVRGFGRRVLW